jgi:hypothetical protein
MTNQGPWPGQLGRQLLLLLLLLVLLLLASPVQLAEHSARLFRIRCLHICFFCHFHPSWLHLWLDQAGTVVIDWFIVGGGRRLTKVEEKMLKKDHAKSNLPLSLPTLQRTIGNGRWLTVGSHHFLL